MSRGAAAAAPEPDTRRAAPSACFMQAEFTVVRSRAGLFMPAAPVLLISSAVV